MSVSFDSLIIKQGGNHWQGSQKGKPNCEIK